MDETLYKRLNESAVDSTMNTFRMLGLNLTKTDDVLEGTGKVVHVQVEFVGDTTGYYIIEMPKTFGCEVANIMLGGIMTVTDIDEMCLSVLSEVGNMVSGAISTAFAEQGVMSDIRPPHIDVRDGYLKTNFRNTLVYETNDKVIKTYLLIVKK